MKKKIDVAIDMAKKFNYREHAMKLDVPMIEGFKEIPSNEANVIFAAGDNFCLEQFISDGALNKNETFEDRVNKSIKEIKDSLVKDKVKITDDNFKLLGDFTNNVFTFRVFLQYMEKGNNLVCQIFAYFLEPKDNDFYQLSLSMGATNRGEIDQICNILREKLVLLLEGVKYKDGV